MVVGALGGMVFVLYLVSKGKLGGKKKREDEPLGASDKGNLEFGDL